MTMLTIAECLLVKVETVPGTDAAPTIADAIAVEDLEFAYEGVRMHPREIIKKTKGKLKSVYGGALMTVSGKVELKGAGAVYDATVKPECDAILQATGHSSTLDATVSSEKYTYSPVTLGNKTVTVYLYLDGMLLKLTGAMGTIDFEFDGLCSANFTLTGHFVGPVDAAGVSPTYNSTVPVPFIDAAFALDAFAPTIASLSFSPNNEMSTPDDVNSADGFGGVAIVDNNVTGSFDMNHVLAATHDSHAKFITGAEMALTTGDIGSVQYNTLLLTMAKIYFSDLSPGKNNGLRSLGNTFDAIETTGDDQYTLVFK